MKIIFEDGKAKMMYDSNALPLMGQIGKLTAAPRVSLVEFEDGGWTVRAVKDTELAIRTHNGVQVLSHKGDLVKFRTKEEAVAAEVNFFWSIVE